MIFAVFRLSFLFSLIALVLAFLYGGSAGLAIAAILGVLEVSVSFDNAVVNAAVLARMSPAWQRFFLTVGMLIAVVGMRLVFPVLIVCVTAKIGPVHAYHLARTGGSVHVRGSYANLLHEAHPVIAAFGGMFLLLLFLDFVFAEREITWLSFIEKPLARIGRLSQVSTAVSLVTLVVAGNAFSPAHKHVSVLLAGILGVVTYVVIKGLGSLFDIADGDATAAGPETIQVVGRAAFFLFLYLEVLDATFSFDGVIGAFAITSDPVIIALGLGIGALYVRSLTVYLVRKGTLGEYVYLEAGAHWAIGALAVLLLVSIKYEVPEVVTGLIGVGFIAAAVCSSVLRNRRLHAASPG